MLTETEFRDKYQSRMRKMTLEDLPAFIADIQAEEQDYGTVCIAIALVATAAAWAYEHSPRGGITGFQAGFVGWEFLSLWGAPETGEIGARLINYEGMLYPQYKKKFSALTIDHGTWERLQKAAQAKLNEQPDASARIIMHWKSIVAGKVPFGYTVEDN